MVYGHDTAGFLFRAALKGWQQENPEIKVYFQNEQNHDIGTEDPTLPRPRMYPCLIPADNFSSTLSGDHEAFIGMYAFKIVTDSLTGTLPSDKVIRSLKEVFKHNRRFVGTQVNTGTGEKEVKYEVQITTPIVVPEAYEDKARKLWLVNPFFEYRADINIDITKEDFEYGLPSA